MSASNLPLSGERLWDSLMEMARIGGTPKGGCNRQTLTDLDGQGRHLLELLAPVRTPDRRAGEDDLGRRPASPSGR